jgi:hypothetical protein
MWFRSYDPKYEIFNGDQHQMLVLDGRGKKTGADVEKALNKLIYSLDPFSENIHETLLLDSFICSGNE